MILSFSNQQPIDCEPTMKAKDFESNIQQVNSTPKLEYTIPASGEITLKPLNGSIRGAEDILDVNLLKHINKNSSLDKNDSTNKPEHSSETMITSNDSKKSVEIPVVMDQFEFSVLTNRDYCNNCSKYLKCGQLEGHKQRCYSKTRSNDVTQYSTIERPNVPKRSYTAHFDQIWNKCNGGVLMCLCGRRFSISDFFNHMRSTHPGVEFSYYKKGKLIGPFKNEQVVAIKTERKSSDSVRKIFKCTICKARDLLQGNLVPHLKKHNNIRIDHNVFELVGVKVQCKLCNKLFKENQIEGHMKRFHPVLIDVDVVKQFVCGLCDAVVLDRYKEQHHEMEHAEVQFERNKFKCHDIKQKGPCGVCGRRINDGRSKHNLKTCLQYMNYRSSAKSFQNEIKRLVEEFRVD